MKLTRVPFMPDLGQSIFEGRKTKTRRLIHPRYSVKWIADTAHGVAPYWRYSEHDKRQGEWVETGAGPFEESREYIARMAPYGPPGSRIVISENYHLPVEFDEFPSGQLCKEGRITKSMVWWAGQGKPDARFGRIRTGRFLPTALARSVCEITEVTVGRLQDISDEDAIAEGIERGGTKDQPSGWKDYGDTGGIFGPTPSFASLWDSINAERGFPWKDNPWVWEYTFKRTFQ